MQNRSVEGKVIRTTSGDLKCILLSAKPQNGESNPLEKLARTFIIILEGSLDKGTIPRVQMIIEPIFKREANKLILDLSRVRQMDSSGIAVLIKWFHEARKRNIRFILAGLNSRVENLLEIEHLKGIFEIIPALEYELKDPGVCSVTGNV